MGNCGRCLFDKCGKCLFVKCHAQTLDLSQSLCKRRFCWEFNHLRHLSRFFSGDRDESCADFPVFYPAHSPFLPPLSARFTSGKNMPRIYLVLLRAIKLPSSKLINLACGSGSARQPLDRLCHLTSLSPVVNDSLLPGLPGLNRVGA